MTRPLARVCYRPTVGTGQTRLNRRPVSTIDLALPILSRPRLDHQLVPSPRPNSAFRTICLNRLSDPSSLFALPLSTVGLARLLSTVDPTFIDCRPTPINHPPYPNRSFAHIDCWPNTSTPPARPISGV
ncbi:hypothetical protein DEO72_LG8g2630 [Vigna unguiculata]|uniref:Uncharacterized protein n=1 Tax=Vigna unguiculata TaxID=3917 RepID=A0A4D6MV20_VIGUN|nr:hypothetical protein DEO72_LG8g2630 [Vigna unguiculata]